MSQEAVVRKKQELRKLHRQQRKELPPAERLQQQAALRQLLISVSKKWDSAITVYMAMPDECSCQGLIDYLFLNKRSVLVPKVQAEHQLTWHWVSSMQELKTGAYGILEPITAAVELPEPVLVLVPGLAFTRNGQRLGMGGGYYDAVLKQLGAASLSIGLAWNCQIEQNIPLEPHDAELNALIAGGNWIKQPQLFLE